MIPIIYDFLLFIEIVILYICGREFAQTGTFKSVSGVSAILIYTLNEGLRYGRGIDYNIYGNLYDFILRGGESDRDITFVYFCKVLQFFGLPYQGLVLFSSAIFIISVLFFLKEYRQIMPIALPFLALLTIFEVESMIRWYIGFSFVLIGCSYLLRDKLFYFFLFNFVGILFHAGLIPILIILYFLYKVKRPLLHPYVSIPVYFIIGFTFQTEYMRSFSDYMTILSFFSERGAQYADNADFWLTGGFSGRVKSSFPGLGLLSFLIVLIWFGYYVVSSLNSRKYIFIYNLTLIGFLFNPISKQIEILYRYDDLLLFFKAILCAKILYELSCFKIRSVYNIRWVFYIIAFYMFFSVFKAPFTSEQRLFLYVWDSKNLTYDKMLNIWANNEDSRTKKFN